MMSYSLALSYGGEELQEELSSCSIGLTFMLMLSEDLWPNQGKRWRPSTKNSRSILLHGHISTACMQVGRLERQGRDGHSITEGGDGILKCDFFKS